METDRLAYFCAIVEAGSLTGAAKLLGVSHSGLSKSMAQLQGELGIPLFRPRGRGLEVTEQGRDVYAKSKTILASLNALRVHDRRASTILRIGLAGPLAHALAGSLAKALGGDLQLGHFDAGDLELLVRERQLDFGFTFVPFPHADIEHLRITTVEFATFARRDAFTGAEPEEIPYVVPSSELRDNPLSLTIKDGWNSGLERSTPFRASSLVIALQLVHAGLAAIYIPTFLAAAVNATAREDVALVRLELTRARRAAEVTERDVFLIKRADDEESARMRRATRTVRSALAALGAPP